MKKATWILSLLLTTLFLTAPAAFASGAKEAAKEEGPQVLEHGGAVRAVGQVQLHPLPVLLGQFPVEVTRQAFTHVGFDGSAPCFSHCHSPVLSSGPCASGAAAT